jgi:hypothetical protein
MTEKTKKKKQEDSIKYFWTGKGVALINGVKYGTGQEIPSEHISPETLKKWEEDGLINTSPVQISRAASSTKDAAKIDALEKEISKLKATKGGDKECKACPEKDAKIKELETENEEKEKVIETLKKDNAALMKQDGSGEATGKGFGSDKTGIPDGM